ncbi:C1q-like domain-containing protein [Dyadobacter sp. 32]|uniref:C1q-like domain-containing protein n=1 Tax=Dyadobacter sp. 32 TaxID=538966 RepID=UPI0011EF005B
MKTNQLLYKTMGGMMIAAAMLLGASSAFAQVKIGTNPTTIDPANNLEIEASTAGRKTSVDKVTGQVTIKDGTEGDGKVLTSDATGGASWKNVSLKAFAGAKTNVRQNMPQSVGPSIMTPIVFQSEITDPTNSFDPATGAFTVPATGLYQVFGSTQFDNNEVPGIPVFYSACLQIYVNASSVVAQSCSQMNVVTTSSSASNIVMLNAGDVLTMRAGAQVASGGTFAAVVSSFYAYKIAD